MNVGIPEPATHYAKSLGCTCLKPKYLRYDFPPIYQIRGDCPIHVLPEENEDSE